MAKFTYAVSLSCFDGEQITRTPLDYIGTMTHKEMLNVVTNKIYDMADKSDDYGVHLHIVAEVLIRYAPDSVYYELDRYGELVVCSDQVTPH